MGAIDDVLARMRDVRVGVIGDLIVDVYLYARPTRLSREAPVMIVEYEREETIPGGASNTACNLAALGVHTQLLARVGDDAPGAAVVHSLQEAGVDTTHVVVHPGEASVTKSRVLAGEIHRTKQQLFRMDRNPPRVSNPDREQEFIRRLEEVDESVHGWVVSDYDYGLVSGAVRDWLRRRAEHKPVIVDSRHRLRDFHGATVLTPNEEEAQEAVGLTIDRPADAEAVGRSLLETLDVEAVLLTRGNLGMMLFQRDQSMLTIPIVGTGEVVDVSGAGDTVVAAFTAAWLAGATAKQAAWFANCAASVVVMKLGAATCRVDELAQVLRHSTQPDWLEGGRS